MATPGGPRRITYFISRKHVTELSRDVAGRFLVAAAAAAAAAAGRRGQTGGLLNDDNLQHCTFHHAECYAAVYYYNFVLLLPKRGSRRHGHQSPDHFTAAI
jgi:hypothetical protein